MQLNLTKPRRVCASTALAVAITFWSATSTAASCGQREPPSQASHVTQLLQLPANLQVLDYFRAPSCRWCAGNRGIEYRTAPGSVVSATTTGVATFVGVVAGTHYVVVRASNTGLVTHGRLASVLVKTGDMVVVGQAIGVAGESLYIGVRVDGQYIDPAQCAGLGSLGKPRAVLVAG
ncbi:MAG: hypothetical protein D4R95_02600 [Actinobacteria bacterium]|nr:MAG: hypothetical protein D4R95_02600 [Actinomycetota bacterium]